MTWVSMRLRRSAIAKRLGVAALILFMAKGLMWLALGIAGYTIWAR